MKVREVMTPNVSTCELDSNLASIASRMWLAECGAMPILGPHGKIAGIVTDRDICFAVASLERPASRITARELVAREGDVHTCGADDELLDALLLMREKRVRRLPVLDAKGRVEGILSMTDAILRAGGPRPDALPNEELLETLRAICERPRRVPHEADLHA